MKGRLTGISTRTRNATKALMAQMLLVLSVIGSGVTVSGVTLFNRILIFLSVFTVGMLVSLGLLLLIDEVLTRYRNWQRKQDRYKRMRESPHLYLKEIQRGVFDLDEQRVIDLGLIHGIDYGLLLKNLEAARTLCG